MAMVQSIQGWTQAETEKCPQGENRDIGRMVQEDRPFLSMWHLHLVLSFSCFLHICTVGIDQLELTKVGVDKVGVDKVGRYLMYI